MKDWFFGLEPRDRKIVIALAVVTTLLTLYGFIWKPLSNDYQTLRESVTQQRETLQWMREAAVKVKSLKRSAPAGAKSHCMGSVLS